MTNKAFAYRQPMAIRRTIAVLSLLVAVAALASGCPIVVTCEDIPCPFGEVCNTESGLCEEIVENCLVDDTVCRAGEVCDEATGRCRPEQLRCGEQFATCPDGQACNAALGRCEPAARCDSDGDCGAAEQCNEAAQECEPRECNPGSDDCPLAYVCGDDERCVPGCRAVDDACPARQFCLVVLGDTVGRCVPNCRVDEECPFGQVCDVAAAPDSRCVPEPPCAGDADCRVDEVCEDSACVQPPCATDTDCLESQICEIATGTCRDAACEEDVYGAPPTPNHDRASAFGLAEGQYTELALCPGRSDWFAIDVRTTDVVRLRVRQRSAQSDIDLFVFAESGELLAADEQLSSISSVKFAAGREQVVFVEIRSRGFDLATYDLTITTEFCPNDNFEENDTRASATVVSSMPGVPSELALMSCGFDEDWFRLNVPAAPNGLRVERTAGTPDLRVDLFAPDGSRFAVGRDEPLTLLRTGSAGTYYVRAVGSLGQTGTYRLVFEVLDDWICPDAAKHATPVAAKTVPPDTRDSETFCPLDGSWEIDWIALQIDRPGLLTATIHELAGVPPLELALVDYDGVESQLIRTGVRQGDELVVQAFVEAGRQYFLRVSSAGAVGRIALEPRYEIEWSLSSP